MTSFRRFLPRAALWLLPAAGLSGPTQAEILEAMPDAIVCSVRDPTGALQWEQLVYYVSARLTDGRTLYKTLTSDPVVLLVAPDGTVDGQNLADCDGYSLDSLRREGRAITFDHREPDA